LLGLSGLLGALLGIANALAARDGFSRPFWLVLLIGGSVWGLALWGVVALHRWRFRLGVYYVGGLVLGVGLLLTRLAGPSAFALFSLALLCIWGLVIILLMLNRWIE